ncbi:transcriptional regulator [Glaciihabitans sp. dw_435]|uniref:ArsR/SmtB family transcription factor n=1 Tax=Glaciihabitans sp. dw_435 TaxID=2720081 RepID=UPI001BD3ABA8|nr:winged helix-turn-helix domain-containing protein [Glaciihabitans sp. dw_435]
MDTDQSEPTGGEAALPPERSIDLDGLKALAHPLRVQIVDTLSIWGPFTASGLAERLGESSGATSYHLRQLEKQGFVREVTGRGTGRERWWERVPGGIAIRPQTLRESPSARAVGDMISREWSRSREALLRDYEEHGLDQLPPKWTDASEVSTVNVRLTADELASMAGDVMAVLDTYVARYRGRTDPDARPVQVHFNAFPVLDARRAAPSGTTPTPQGGDNHGNS